MSLTTSVEEVRAFNRFYTNILSLLDHSILQSGYSLAEARVLYEIKTMAPCGARDIMGKLNIDEGYLSRILNQFVSRGLVLKSQSPSDKRQYLLTLSNQGATAATELANLANHSIAGLIDHLTDDEVRKLLDHMNEITKLLHEPKTY